MKPTRYMFINHQGKGDAYRAALDRAGWFLYSDLRRAINLDFCMVDKAVESIAGLLEKYRQAGTRRFFIYPHDGGPNLLNDIVPEWPHVTAHFVVSNEHAAIMRAYGYDKPIHPVGWHLCPIRAFRACLDPRRILFAPIHPPNEATDRVANQATFARLLPLAQAGAIVLTVRHIGALDRSGLDHVDHPNVIYTAGQLRRSYDQIDRADLVVGRQTFASLAIARGIPVVTFAESMPRHERDLAGNLLPAQNWRAYRDRLAYPLDLLAVPPDQVADLLRQAGQSDAPIADWRQRMIGDSFDPARFLYIVESYL